MLLPGSGYWRWVWPGSFPWEAERTGGGWRAIYARPPALLAGLTFPLFVHWTWGGGFLAQLGLNYGLGRGYLDAGGAGPIHALGGLTALAITWIVGPRRGKYTSEGMPMAIPGHNPVLVLFDARVALKAGGLGLNSPGAMLFAVEWNWAGCP